MPSLRMLSLIFLLLFGLTALTAENFSVDYLLSYPETALKAAEAPFHWSSDDWTCVGGIIFAGGALYLFDEEISAAIIRNRDHFTHQAADVGNLFGDGKLVLPVLGATYAAGFLLHNAPAKDTALLAYKSFLLASTCTTVIKYATQRQRPVSGNGKSFWNGAGFKLSRDSFPSGHATVAWSVMSILAMQYKDTKWVPPLAYSAAALTGYARMHDERHWPTDVLAGAVIGYTTAKLVMQTTPRLTVTPAAELDGVQVNLNF